MARKPGAGRKAAKNELASALIDAIKFGSVLKAATTTSIPQAHYVWMNAGTAIMFDGIVAAGHPIPPGIAGYPHAKLLLDALDNTDKTFTQTVHDNGDFEIASDKYSARVPALAYDQVIPTVPDAQQAQITDPVGLVAAFEALLKVTVETGDNVAYSSVRVNSGAMLGTNGAVILEVRDTNGMPPIVMPRQFVNAVVKAGGKPTGMGIGADWQSFTIWFENGAWLRTNLYKAEDWPEAMVNSYYAMIQSNDTTLELNPKLWAAIDAVLPFADGNNRVQVRPGIVRTHPDRAQGAALDVKEVGLSFDVDGKRFLSLAQIATYGSTGQGETGPILRFFGDGCRGLVACLEPLADIQSDSGSDWGAKTAPAPAAATTNGGWGVQADLAPAPEPETAHSEDLNPAGKWKNGPEPGTADSPEFLSQLNDKPESDYRVEYDDSFIMDAPDGLGIPLEQVGDDGFTASGWVNSLTNADAGFKE